MLHFSNITLCSPNFPRYPDGGEDIYFEMHFRWPTCSERGSYLPHAKVARVHPEGPPSDTTPGARQWDEQRPPQKLPLTLWHWRASSLPLH